MKKRILVCGATGFIGRNIAEYFCGLRDKYEVRGTYFRSRPPSDKRIEAVKADLTDKSDVTRVMDGVDIVIQAAATTSGSKDILNKPYYHITDNTVMNALIFREAFEKKAARVIFFSCTLMYHSGDTPLKETDYDPSRPLYPAYFGGAWMKVYNEKMCEFYAGISDTAFTVIRHSNIYGPHDKYDLERSHVFGATVTKVMTAPDGGDITVWGDGSEARDLLYVSDIVSFVEAALEKQKTKFEIFNAGSSEAVSVKDLAARIIKHSGKSINVKHDLSKPGIKTKLCLDTSKALEHLGWKPSVSLDEGIRKTLEWYAKNQAARP
jgi:nucleoside-diphosphate-sugar epimerase